MVLIGAGMVVYSVEITWKEPAGLIAGGRADAASDGQLGPVGRCKGKQIHPVRRCDLVLVPRTNLLAYRSR